MEAIPLQVRTVRIEGNERTHDEFIERELLPAKQATNLNDVLEGLHHAMANLESYGIFDKCHIELQRASPSSSSSSSPSGASSSSSSSSQSSSSSSSPPLQLADVRVTVKEKVWYGLRSEVTQELHTQRTSVRLQGVLRNLLGRGERIEASTEGSLPWSQTFSLSLTKPRFLSLPLRCHAGINSNILNLSRVSSYAEHSRGLTFSVSDPSGRHEVGYELALRELYPSARELSADEQLEASYQGPSEAVVKASVVPSTKSSLRYAFTLDRLDSRLVPTLGSFVQGRVEGAGLGGDVRFLKGQVDCKYFSPVHPLVSLGLSLTAGALYPLSGSASHLTDRYFFGTPLTMRGFEAWSVGPLDHHDNLGGELTASVNVSASTPFPDSMGGSEGGPRLHAFLNGGNLISRGKAGWGAVGRDLFGTARLSVGVGVVIPTPLGRLEFNLVRALRKMDSDRTRNLQFGLGLQFL